MLNSVISYDTFNTIHIIVTKKSKKYVISIFNPFFLSTVYLSY